jgi:peptidoglycan/LPS O-acetylase OafA/YrhL
LVVFFHNFGFIEYFHLGWLGVDLFFVLSGFLITEILLNTVGQKGYLKCFFLKRVLRIFPLYYLVLSFSFFVLPQVPSLKDNVAYYVEYQAWLWLYLQNWLYIIHKPEDTNFLVHFWSLAVEEQFYLLWPFVILWIRKPKLLLALVSFVLLFVVCLRVWLGANHLEVKSYFNPYTFTRVDGLCIGCMLALVKQLNFNFISRYSTPIVLVLALLNFGFYFLNQANSFSFPYVPFFGYTSFAIVFALLVYEAIRERNKIINTVFTLAPLKFLGRISYGFYVFHYPIYLALSPKLSNALQVHYNLPTQLSLLVSSIVATLLAFVISIISYYTFEMKFFKLKGQINKLTPNN